jgi:hypothetical protein
VLKLSLEKLDAFSIVLGFLLNAEASRMARLKIPKTPRTVLKSLSIGILSVGGGAL